MASYDHQQRFKIADDSMLYCSETLDDGRPSVSYETTLVPNVQRQRRLSWLSSKASFHFNKIACDLSTRVQEDSSLSFTSSISPVSLCSKFLDHSCLQACPKRKHDGAEETLDFPLFSYPSPIQRKTYMVTSEIEREENLSCAHINQNLFDYEIKVKDKYEETYFAKKKIDFQVLSIIQDDKLKLNKMVIDHTDRTPISNPRAITPVNMDQNEDEFLFDNSPTGPTSHGADYISQDDDHMDFIRTHYDYHVMDEAVDEIWI